MFFFSSNYAHKKMHITLIIVFIKSTTLFLLLEKSKDMLIHLM